MRFNAASDGCTSVAARIFAILDAFLADSSVLTLAELARQTGIAKPTVYRIAQDLVRRRVLDRTEHGYRLGFHLFELGHHVPAPALREKAVPFMEDLYEATRETVHLGVLTGTEVLHIEKIRGHNSFPVPSSLGARFPSYCTALGKAMLAFSPPDVVNAVIEAGLKPRTSHTITDPKQFIAELQRVATRGIAYDREELQLGVVCVAAPLLDQGGGVMAALSVTGAVARLRLDRLGLAVQTAARGVSRALARRASS